MDVQIECVGTSPFLMNNPQMADDQFWAKKEIAKLTAKKNRKTDDDRARIADLEFVGGLYFDPDRGPYVPVSHLRRATVEAGKITRQGKVVERGLIYGPTYPRRTPGRQTLPSSGAGSY